MSKRIIYLSLTVAVMALGLAGCTSSTGGGVETKAYVATKDRIDQKMEGGNFGYIMGKPKQPDLSKMSKSREVFVLEVTKNPDVTPDQLRKPVPPAQPIPIYVPERSAQSTPVYHPPAPIIEQPSVPPANAQSAAVVQPSDYVIQKGDTLQKISKKVYGTYKKWYKIYEANKDILPDANRIKPGLTIRIP